MGGMLVRFLQEAEAMTELDCQEVYWGDAWEEQTRRDGVSDQAATHGSDPRERGEGRGGRRKGGLGRKSLQTNAVQPHRGQWEA